MLIHNERDVKSTQPRASLNPLTLLLGVAAWERFVVDLGALSRGQWPQPGIHLRVRAEPAVRLDEATKTLKVVTGGKLSDAWRIRTFTSWFGKSPTKAVDLDCSDPQQYAKLAADVLSFIQVRNKVAHREVTAAAGFTRAKRRRLPDDWFVAEPPAGMRRVDTPGAFWGGHELLR